MDNRIFKAHRIVTRLSPRGRDIALMGILMGYSVLQSLLQGQRSNPDSKQNKEKMVRDVAVNAQAAKIVGKKEIRLHVFDGRWFTRHVAVDRAEWLARRMLEDGATKIKVY